MSEKASPGSCLASVASWPMQCRLHNNGTSAHLRRPQLHRLCHHPDLAHTVIMKVLSISIFQTEADGGNATVLATANDLSSFSFYQRGSAGEFMTFMSKTVAERTSPGQRQSVEEQGNLAHVFNRGGSERLTGECSHPPRYPTLTFPQPSLLPIRSILLGWPSLCSPRFWTTFQPKFLVPTMPTLQHSSLKLMVTCKGTRIPGKQTQ